MTLRIYQALGLATLLLPACLLAGCGGDPVARDTANGRVPVERGVRVSSPNDQEVDPRVAQVQEAVRDLGLVDPAQDVRLDAASAEFGALSTEQLGVALLDESPAVRQAAIDALLTEPEVVVLKRMEQLRFAMTDPDEAVRESVVAVLSNSSDPRVIALLLDARGDESPVVREDAREALAELREQTDHLGEKTLHSGD